MGQDAAPEQSLLLIGLSHRTASVDVRERHAIPPDRQQTVLDAARALSGVHEVFVLSTCNRTEVLISGRIDSTLEQGLIELFFARALAQELYRFRGVQAVLHVFSVAAGLDSLVLGESQILGQVKDALSAAEDCRSLGGELRALLNQALSVGKRVRSETHLGSGTLSVARVGVDLAQRVFSNLKDSAALIVGVGETGLLVAQHLRSEGIGKLLFANRSAERAAAAAQEFGGLSCSLDELHVALGQIDMVIACVDGTRHLIHSRLLKAAGLDQRDRPLLAIDLSVPRAIDPLVAGLPGVLYYDLDDLSRVVEENHKRRAQAEQSSAPILVGEVHKYLARREYASAAPTVNRLKERFEAIREQILDELVGAKSDPQALQLAHTLTKRLLDATFASIKEGLRDKRSADELELEYKRYLENL